MIQADKIPALKRIALRGLRDRLVEQRQEAWDRADAAEEKQLHKITFVMDERASAYSELLLLVNEAIDTLSM